MLLDSSLITEAPSKVSNTPFPIKFASFSVILKGRPSLIKILSLSIMDADNSSAISLPSENNKITGVASSNNVENPSWGKSLKEMPLFSIKEIEIHRQASGKGNAIIKTLDRERKFKEERYLSADFLFTRVADDHFNVKAKCKASMKKEIREVEVSLNRETGLVVFWKCSCSAGKSGYCNHVMALLFELADYSLNQLETVPEEIACTSKSRQWGIPGQSAVTKEPWQGQLRSWVRREACHALFMTQE